MYYNKRKVTYTGHDNNTHEKKGSNAMIKQWFYYQFSDGYFCYTGKMNKSDILFEERQHGKLVLVKKLPKQNKTYITSNGKEYTI